MHMPEFYTTKRGKALQSYWIKKGKRSGKVQLASSEVILKRREAIEKIKHQMGEIKELLKYVDSGKVDLPHAKSIIEAIMAGKKIK